jgi:hypothetical protein
MNTGQTILALGALILLATIMLNFYGIFNSSWDSIDGTQLGIDATTIATSYMEIVHGLAFDEAVLDANVIVQSEWDFKLPGTFGPPDTVTSVNEFTVFDHFHGVRDTTTVPGLGTYATEFEVHYVLPGNVQEFSLANQTYLKRMDMKIWRINPPPPVTAGIDTVRMWTVMGYFSFQ